MFVDVEVDSVHIAILPSRGSDRVDSTVITGRWQNFLLHFNWPTFFAIWYNENGIYCMIWAMPSFLVLINENTHLGIWLIRELLRNDLFIF